jgi:hypothetical protein
MALPTGKSGIGILFFWSIGDGANLNEFFLPWFLPLFNPSLKRNDILTLQSQLITLKYDKIKGHTALRAEQTRRIPWHEKEVSQ